MIGRSDPPDADTSSGTPPVDRARLRELGIRLGDLNPGPLNAITDVAGVKVGHATIVEDAPHVVRSGVTVILPHSGNLYDENCFGAVHVLNGCGEATGLVWLRDFGRICGPIALTGTYSVGAVHEGLIRAEIAAAPAFDFRLPIVAETSDAWLSEGAALAVRPEHVLEALTKAAEGPVAEGSVGGGTGMNCHEFKAGIGTASRVVPAAGARYRVGVLVQANHGRRRRLQLDGIRVGRAVPVSEVPAPWPGEKAAGSIIVVAATDAPLLPMQCRRLAQRAALGIGRVGGVGETPSGDIAIAFSTGNRIPHWGAEDVTSVRMLRETALTALYDGLVEATEEAIWNALCMAETMTGKEGRTSHAIPLDRLQEIVVAYKNSDQNADR